MKKSMRLRKIPDYIKATVKMEREIFDAKTSGEAAERILIAFVLQQRVMNEFHACVRLPFNSRRGYERAKREQPDWVSLDSWPDKQRYQELAEALESTILRGISVLDLLSFRNWPDRKKLMRRVNKLAKKLKVPPCRDSLSARAYWRSRRGKSKIPKNPK